MNTSLYVVPVQIVQLEQHRRINHLDIIQTSQKGIDLTQTLAVRETKLALQFHQTV